MNRSPKLMRRGVLAGIAVTALAISAPVRAERGIYEPVPLKLKEPNDLIEDSKELNAQLERRSLLLTDPSVLDLVRRIGHELAPAPTDDYIDYEFFVVRDPSPNAFALPNGHVYVHTGILARLQDDAQLAALLAHEINHVAGHHGIVEYRVSAKKILIGIFGGSLASALTTLRFSRDLEQEADDRAVELLRDSPYDAHALPELMELLAKDFEGVNPRMPTMWTTHPDPEKRVETSRALVADLPAGGRDAAAFAALIRPVRALTIRDYIQDDYPYTALVLAQNLVERYPAELEWLLLEGDAWQALGPSPTVLPEDLRNRDKWRNVRQRIFKTRQERIAALLKTEEGRQAFAINFGRAKSTYEQVLAVDSGYAPAYRGLGEAHEALGAPRDAARAYIEYLRRAPQAADRPIIIERLERLRDSLQ